MIKIKYKTQLVFVLVLFILLTYSFVFAHDNTIVHPDSITSKVVYKDPRTGVLSGILLDTTKGGNPSYREIAKHFDLLDSNGNSIAGNNDIKAGMIK